MLSAIVCIEVRAGPGTQIAPEDTHSDETQTIRSGIASGVRKSHSEPLGPKSCQKTAGNDGACRRGAVRAWRKCMRLQKSASKMEGGAVKCDMQVYDVSVGIDPRRIST